MMVIVRTKMKKSLQYMFFFSLTSIIWSDGMKYSSVSRGSLPSSLSLVATSSVLHLWRRVCFVVSITCLLLSVPSQQLVLNTHILFVHVSVCFLSFVSNTQVFGGFSQKVHRSFSTHDCSTHMSPQLVLCVIIPCPSKLIFSPMKTCTFLSLT